MNRLRAVGMVVVIVFWSASITVNALVLARHLGDWTTVSWIVVGALFVVSAGLWLVCEVRPDPSLPRSRQKGSDD